MSKYIILGADNLLLTDYFDAIHALGGQVEAVYQNMPLSPPKRGLSIPDRIAQLSYPVDHFESLDGFEPKPGIRYVLGLATPKKYAMVEAIKQQHDLRFESVIHPESYLGSNVQVGEGAFINARATIAPNTVVDDFASINRMAVIGHDAYIGKHTRIGPSVSLAGGTILGERCSIGINATILDYVQIGSRSVIGAGSVVTKDVPEGKVALGIPAKVIKDNDNQ